MALDLTQMSDAELLALRGSMALQEGMSPQAGASPDLSGMSDADLAALHASMKPKEAAPAEQPPPRFANWVSDTAMTEAHPGSAYPSTSDVLMGRGDPFPYAAPGSWGDMGNFAFRGPRTLAHNLLTGAERVPGALISPFTQTTTPTTGLVPPRENQMRNPQGQADDLLFNWLMPPYMPETRAGRITQAAGAGLAAAPLGPLAVGTGMLAGGGAQAINETDLSPWLKVPAETLLPLAPGAYFTRRGALSNAVRTRTEGMTDADWIRASEIERRSRDLGVPLMAPEAMDSGPLQRFTSDVRASRTGGPLIDALLQMRPNQVRAAVGQEVLDPITRMPLPQSALGSTVQETASNALLRAERERTAASRPHFDAASNADLPVATLQPILNDLNVRIGRLGSTPARAELTRLRDAIGDENGNVLHTNVGQISDQNQSFFNRAGYDPANPNAVDKATVGIVTPHAQAIERALQTNPDFAMGRSEHARLTPAVEQAQGTPLTPLARTTEAGTQGRAIGPSDVDISGDIRRTWGRMMMVNPTAWPQLARDYFQRAFEPATKPIQSGENPAMGYNFAKSVNGTDAQKANNHAILEGVAQANGVPPGELIAGFDNAMEILDRTARIPGIGSQTAERGNVRSELSRGPGTGLGVLNPLEIPDKMVGALKGMYMSRAYRQFAQIITQPEGVARLRQLSQFDPGDARARAIIGGMIGLSTADSQGQ